jgi:hypothetical protein
MRWSFTDLVRDIANVIKAVGLGDLTKFVEADVDGEMLDVKITVNHMVSQLSLVASEVTRITREVGTEGKFGGQAEVEGVQGTWKDVTENVNVRSTPMSFLILANLLVTDDGKHPDGPSSEHLVCHQGGCGWRLDKVHRRGRQRGDVGDQ